MGILRVSVNRGKSYETYLHHNCFIGDLFIISIYSLVYSQAISLLFLDKDASQTMLDTAHQLIKCGKSQGILRHNVHVLGARQVSQTASPGNHLYTKIQDWPEWSSEP